SSASVTASLNAPTPYLRRTSLASLQSLYASCISAISFAFTPAATLALNRCPALSLSPANNNRFAGNLDIIDDCMSVKDTPPTATALYPAVRHDKASISASQTIKSSVDFTYKSAPYTRDPIGVASFS